MLGVGAAATAVVGLGVAGVKSAGEFEQSRVAFETMLGSADKARKMMIDIAKFAKETPFELPEVVAGSKQLLAFGFAQEQILPTMRKLGDLAAGLGVPIGQLTNVFGQVRVAGRLMGQDLLQFTNAGVPLIEALANTMHKPQNEIKKLVEEGKVGFPQVETALNSLTGANSRFGGMMEKQSHTLNGVISNIKDGFGQALRSLVGITAAGDIIQGGLFDKIKHGAEALIPIVQRLPEIMKEGFDKVRPYIPLIAGAIVGMLIPAFISLSIAIGKSVVALGPWAVLGTGIALVIQQLNLNFDDLRGIVSALHDPMQKLVPVLVGVAATLTGIFWPAIVSATGALTTFVAEALLLAQAAVIAFAPFIAIGAAIAAVTAGIIYAYKHFVPFHDLVQAVGKYIGGTFKSILNSLGSIFRQLADSLKPLFEPLVSFFQQHKDTIMNFLKVLGIGLGLIAFGPLVMAIAGFIGALKLLQVVLSFVAKHFEIFKDIVLVIGAIVFSPLLLAIGVAIVALKSIMAIVNIAGDVFKAVFGAVGAAASVFGAMISTIFGTMYNVIKATFEGIWMVVSPILNFIKDLFIIVFGGILLVVLTILDTLKSIIVNAFKFYYGTISSILNAIWGVVSSIWNVIFGVISTVLGWVSDRIVNAFNFYKNIIVGVFNSVRDFVSGVWNQIYSIISGVVGSILNFFAPAFNWLLDRGRDIIRGLVSGIRSVAGEVWNAIKAAADQIGNFFSGAGRWLYETGKAILQGLINGMKDMIGKVGEVAGNVAEGVKNKFKSILGIHSPSKVFADYGHELLAGMAGGMKGATGLVVGAANDMFGAVRRLMPYSDAKEGPLRDLTLSGQRFSETFARGITQSAQAVQNAVTRALMFPDQAINAAINPGMMAGYGVAATAPMAGGAGSTVDNRRGGDTYVQIDTINDRSDADYILSQLDRNTQLQSMGVSPAGGDV